MIIFNITHCLVLDDANIKMPHTISIKMHKSWNFLKAFSTITSSQINPVVYLLRICCLVSGVSYYHVPGFVMYFDQVPG